MAGRQRKSRSQAGRLRIVAGNWRSRLLDIADVEGLRPTSERVRETLFNWLAPHIHGARCIDAYAGTGALGLEALSRGARSVLFLERSQVAVKQLRLNIEMLGARGATVRHGDALDFLRNASPTHYDIAFLDPPFADDLHEETCRLLSERDLLTAGAHVYLELPKGGEVTLPRGWQVLKDRNAGNVRYMLVRVDRSD